MTPDEILTIYDQVGPEWDKHRNKSLFERRWLDRMVAHTPLNGAQRCVLDLGCGTGRPLASYLDARGLKVTGIDGAASMVAAFGHNLPNADVMHHDMRSLQLDQKFDAIMAWNSFFHLKADDQRAMFEIFAAHAAPRAALLFTSGPFAGETLGEVVGQKVYHASLSPAEYRQLFDKYGFEELAFVPEDPDCNGHTIWLARFVGTR